MNIYDEVYYYSWANTKDDSFPLLAFRRHPKNKINPMHIHARGQYTFAEKELLIALVDNAYWYILPGQGIWVPPDTYHEIFCVNDNLCMFNLIDPSYCDSLPKKTRICEVSPLVLALSKKCMEYAFSYKKNSREFSTCRVLIDQIAFLPESNLSLPMVSDDRLKKIVELFMSNLAEIYDLDTLAEMASMSKRNLNRIFIAETGLSVGEWRRKQKILFSIQKLYASEKVSSIASGLGYNGVSAFIETFKAITGETPGSLVRKYNVMA